MLTTLTRLLLLTMALVAQAALAEGDPSGDAGASRAPRLATRATRGELLEELASLADSRPSLLRPILMVSLAPVGAGAALSLLGYSIPGLINVSSGRGGNVVSNFLVGAAQVWFGLVTFAAVIVGAGLLAVAIIGVVKLARRERQLEQLSAREADLRRQLDERDGAMTPPPLGVGGLAPRPFPLAAVLVPVATF